jgi:hypothetical protein
MRKGKNNTVIVISIAVIAIIIIGVIIAIIVNFAKSSKNVVNGITATIDGQNVKMYDKASKALSSLDVYGSGNLVIEIPDGHEAEVIIRGTVGGIQKEYSATTSLSSDNLINVIRSTGISHNGGFLFNINGDLFDENTIAYVTITSEESNRSLLDKRFGANKSKSASFAFTAHHAINQSDEEPIIIREETEEDTSNALTSNTDSSNNTVSPSQQDIFAETVQPSGEIQINGSISFDTYSSKDDALSHTQELPSNFETNATFQVFPGENTMNCSIIADSVYDSNGDKEKNPQFEIIIGGTSDFIGNVDITQFRGKTVIFCIMFVSKGEHLVPHNSYEYFAVKVPTE